MQEVGGSDVYIGKQIPKYHSQIAIKDIMRYKTSRVQNYLPMTTFVRQLDVLNEYEYFKILYLKPYSYLLKRKNLTVSKREISLIFKVAQSLSSLQRKNVVFSNSRGHIGLLPMS